ncbi:MAG: hypothetical protein RM021_024085 [Nostoc sp. EkiNYC01]|nr:hypothetical protein [Nostoc sp. EkiNYC01]
MVSDADAHAEIDTKNLADSLIYQAQKQLQDLSDRVSLAIAQVLQHYYSANPKMRL